MTLSNHALWTGACARSALASVILVIVALSGMLSAGQAFAVPYTINFEGLTTQAFEAGATCETTGGCLHALSLQWLEVTGVQEDQIETYSQETYVEAAPSRPTGLPFPIFFDLATTLDSTVTQDYGLDTWHWQTSLPFGGSTTGGDDDTGTYFFFEILVDDAGLTEGLGFQVPGITGEQLLANSTFSMTVVVDGVNTTLDGSMQRVTATPIPEPGTALFMALGLLALGAGRRSVTIAAHGVGGAA